MRKTAAVKVRSGREMFTIVNEEAELSLLIFDALAIRLKSLYVRKLHPFKE
jgi:hypothetical protein